MPEQPCAFHPDRLTLVSCSRCDRPICPDDMIDAPVGIHCPVCAGRMREGPLGETAYRARVKAERLPGVRLLQGTSVTRLLLAANVLIFVLMLATGRPTDPDVLLRFGALPPVLPRAQWWRLFSAMFVHVGLLHLLFNMFALSMFGPAIEERLGKLRFLALFFVSGLLGSAASLAFVEGGLRAGASGGVFGILGAWIGYFALHRHVRAAGDQLRSLLMLVGLNLVIGFSVRGIDNFAHLGGLAAGFAIGLSLEITARRPSHQRTLAALTAYGGVVVVALALVAPRVLP